MVTIQLDQRREQRLGQLAQAQGQDATRLAQRIIEDYLDFQTLPPDTEEAWAAASVQLAAEVFDDESWNEDEPHGSR
jgi:predicted transcriptional regulator